MQIFICSYRCVEEKNKRGQTQRSKVQHERFSSSLLEDHKEADEQIDQTDQINVEITPGPIWNGSQMIEISIIDSRFNGIRREFYQIVKLRVNTPPVQS